MLNADQLQRLKIGPEWVDALNQTFERFGISSPVQQAASGSVGMSAETSASLRKI